MNRLDKIKQEFFEQFQDKLDEEQVNLSVESAFDILVSADPSRNKKNVRWLMETYLDDGFLWEDLDTNLHCNVSITGGEDVKDGKHSKVYETLQVFMKHSRKLDIVDRSINRYQSLADIWKMVKQYAEDKTGKEVKREEHDRALTESKMVIDNDDIRIVVPMTEYASKFHGRGTRWCTAADNHNRFWRYAKDSPLFIITLKERGDKLQLWRNNDNIQFMDEDNKKVSLDYIKENWSLLKGVIQFTDSLEYIPDKLRTPELCEIAVKQDGAALHLVPDKLRTPELCEIAIKHDGYSLGFVPNEFKTYELCKIAVKQNGYALYYVPDELKTSELCKIAFEQNIMAFQFIPDVTVDGVAIKTPELCKVTVQYNGVLLDSVPDMTPDGLRLKTYELCELACKENGRALKYVPKELKTYELCKLACEQDGGALYFVPKHLITPELCKKSCEKNGMALVYVPKELRTPELCRLAVEQDGRSLYSVPDMTPDGVSLKTYELCILAVKQNSEALKYVPDRFKTPEWYALLNKQDVEIPSRNVSVKEYAIPTDVYEQKINKLKTILTTPLIEPGQTIHHVKEM